MPLSVFVAPANYHDSRLYFPTVKSFKIKITMGRPITRPKVIIGDAGFDTKDIRESNSNRGIKSVIPINPRNKKKNNVGRPIKFDKEIYKKRSSIERFFSRIEAYKKLYPRHERIEESYLGLVRLACALIIWEEVLG